MGPTAGYKTPAFWLTLLMTACGAVMASGAAMPGFVAQGVGLTMAALAASGYASIRAFVKGPDGKPAWRTTEFWLSIVAVLVSVAVASGAFPEGGQGAKVLAFATSLLSAAGYYARFQLPPR